MATSVMTLLNFFSALTTPTTYCLAAYLLFFGILVVLVELQEYAVFSRSCRTPWMQTCFTSWWRSGFGFCACLAARLFFTF